MKIILIIMIFISNIYASDLFICRAVGGIDFKNKKFIKAVDNVFIKIIPSSKRDYIYYNGRSEYNTLSFEDGKYKYYWIQGGYIGFNEIGLSAVVISRENAVVYDKCIKSDSIERFRKEASGFLNATEDARNLNNAMKLH